MRTMRFFRIRRWWIPPLLTALLFMAFLAIQWHTEARAVATERSMGHYAGQPGFLHEWAAKLLGR